MSDHYEKTPSPKVQAEANYAHTVPDECETVYWRGQILSMNELAALAQQPASNAPVGVEDLIRRIDAAIERITSGRCTMRVPADPTDPDLVLADAGNWIQRHALAQQPAAADELAARLVDELDGLVSESDGVTGLHLNGDVATWEELLPGGRFERLSSLDDLREALAAKVSPKRRPYNASGSLSEYGVFPECDAQPKGDK